MTIQPSKYVKLPVAIEAMQVTKANIESLRVFCPHFKEVLLNEQGQIVTSETGAVNIGLIIPTLEGGMLAREGDWLIKGVKGEFYPCKNDIFIQTYEAIKQ